MISYIQGEDLIWHVKEYDMVLVGCGLKNSMGNGFHRKVCLSFPEVMEDELHTGYNDRRKLGTVLISGTGPSFALCFITKGRQRPDISPDSLDYKALEDCLSVMSERAAGKKIAMTLMGSSPYEGGGDPDRVKDIIDKTLCRNDVDVYLYEQEDYEKEFAERWHRMLDMVPDMTREEYLRMKMDIMWEEKFGFYLPKPEAKTLAEFKKILKNTDRLA